MKKFHTPTGLFTKTAKDIAETLLKEGKTKALKRLVFYVNRAGKNLHPASLRKLTNAKAIIERATRERTNKLSIKRASRITRRAPSKRLVKRREKRDVKGYFPNPVRNEYVIYSHNYKNANIVFYVGMGILDTEEKNAALYTNLKLAEKVARSISIESGNTFNVEKKN